MNLLHSFRRTMRSSVAVGKGRFYKKSLIMLLLVASIPGIIIGSLVYWMAGGRLERELLQLHNRQIEQRASNIDEQLSNLELMLSHWAFDSKFDTSLKNLTFGRDFETARDIAKTLLVMQGSNSIVSKVELYLSGRSPKLFDPDYSPVTNKDVQQVYEGLLHSSKVMFWSQRAFDPRRPNHTELTLVHQIPGASVEPFGSLIVRLDNQKVADWLRTMTPYNSGVTYFLQGNGELFTSVGEESPDSPFVKELREQIRARGTGKGSFLMDWNHAKYTVTYGKFTRISEDWLYASASPISSITGPVVFISKVILIVSFSSLLLALLLAWLASQSIYSPVNRLMLMLLTGKAVPDDQKDEFLLIERQWQLLNRESNDLHAKLAEQLPQVKESFLHQLLQGYLYAYSEDDLRDRMERFKWQVEGNRFMIVYIRLTGITSLDGRFRYGDEGLVTFAAVNMIEELAAKYFDQADALNFHDLTAGLLVTVPEEQSDMRVMQSFCDELTQVVNRILKMWVTIAISRPTKNVGDIPLAFEEAKQAASYRNFENENQIVEMNLLEIRGEDSAELQYPFTLERELIQALRTGRESDAYELLEDFLETLSAKGAKEIDVQQGMLHLLGSLQHAIMVSGIQPNRLFKGVNLYEQLSQIREPALFVSWFKEKVIEPFLKELVGRSNAQVKRMIEQAMIYLQTFYMKDISLDSCADHIGSNPFFLSKSFKQVTGKNFIDYLTELRMDKAKELLRESELKINDVADRVGYQHSYFNRIFKKLEGVTPSRYRELSRSE